MDPVRFYQPRRAVGGHYVHAVDLATTRSACGHVPKNRGGMARAGWRGEGGLLCPHCRKALGVDLPPWYFSPNKPTERVPNLTSKQVALVASKREAGEGWEAIAVALTRIAVGPWTAQAAERFFETLTPPGKVG